MTERQLQLARFALGKGALKLVPNRPVRWASGYLMPVYNDNRLLLRYPEGRAVVKAAFLELIDRLGLERSAVEGTGGAWDGVAGTATAGIAPAVLLAEELGTAFYYVRSSAKGHGLERRIEGLESGATLADRRILLVEDLLSTGGSAASAAEALIAAGAALPYCVAIFTYGFDVVDVRFDELPERCLPRAILSFPELLDVAKNDRYVTTGEAAMLEKWWSDPFAWRGGES